MHFQNCLLSNQLFLFWAVSIESNSSEVDPQFESCIFHTTRSKNFESASTKDFNVASFLEQIARKMLKWLTDERTLVKLDPVKASSKVVVVIDARTGLNEGQELVSYFQNVLVHSRGFVFHTNHKVEIFRALLISIHARNLSL